MALFQKTVEQKYLKQINAELINAKYLEFKSYFGNPDIQENIRNSKEEQFQEGFLRELFVKILGYTLNPEPNFNLTTEYKNIKDSKKADGAIILDKGACPLVTAVIELKGTNTTDLSKIEAQAFGYKNNQPDCVYVVTSNFEKLRFYIDNAIEHIEFNLFTLSKADFETLYLCLSFESIEKGIPKKIKEESLSQEDVITKKLYQDYSLFKRELHQNLVALNPQYDSLTLFKKSQKLLDRFLFVFFAEDRHLLPPYFTRIIIRQWQQLKDLDEYIPLYDRFKKNFRYLNDGFKGKDFEVYAYNGGLFKPDDILDSLTIDDELLHKHTVILSERDFASEVDVNILGHIFENSLNELDEINAQLAGETIDKTKTKRKKDGVFYTPKYITKYIVENTVGKLCTEKKDELQLVEEEYISTRGHAPLQKKTKQALYDKLKTYQNWLLQLTICDPACGSGAFLNQALDFLITEHRYIDELQAKLLGVPLIFSDIEKSILENNLFGVDLNEESVEIAKLSLWLRTAQPNRKLNDLNNNIKCGNSLIDDPTVAGDKAFNWHEAFPQVFEKGGFDVVIGNPPYVRLRESYEAEKSFFLKNYKTAVYQIDLYILFIERGISLMNINGFTSSIIPNAWLNNLFQIEARRFILNNTSINEIVAMPSKTFEQANVDTIIVSLSAINEYKHSTLLKFENSTFIEVGHVHQKTWLENENLLINISSDININILLEKIIKDTTPLESIAYIGRGVGVYHKRVGHTKELIDADPYQSTYIKDETFVPYIRGKSVTAWNLRWNNDSYISYGKWLAEPREPKFFEGERIILRQIPSDRLIATYIDKHFIIDQSVFISRFYEDTNVKPKYVLALISSKLFSFYFRNLYSEFDELFPKVKLQHFKNLPIKVVLEENQQPFIVKADQMLSLNKQLQETSQKFQRNLQREFNLEKLSGKLENWFQAPFNEFLKELEKNKVKLTLSQKAEWEDYFLQEQKKAIEIKHLIDTTDKEIDQMVYQLYGLSEEEIKIVENN
jgi:type I restriction-modification system DNA methylase subunit